MISLENVHKKQHPSYKAILGTLTQELMTLEKGIEFHYKNKTNIKGFLHSVISDMSARGKILNFRGHTGKQSNIYSYQMGVYSKTRRTVIYPYLENVQKRTPMSIKNDVSKRRNGFEQHEPCQLWHLPYFNILSHYTLDSMHNIFHGVYHDVLELFLNPPPDPKTRKSNSNPKPTKNVTRYPKLTEEEESFIVATLKAIKLPYNLKKKPLTIGTTMHF